MGKDGKWGKKRVNEGKKRVNEGKKEGKWGFLQITCIRF